jgi:predicted lipoprotein with Yx(FWY)xxD motif
MTSYFIGGAGALAVLFAASAVQAHVTVQPKTALPGSQQTLRFVVGHGCNGQPTTGLTIDIPAGVDQVQPQPKPGWSVSTQKSKAGLVELVWSGGVFAPHEADGFEVAVRLPAQPGALAFPAFQSCGDTVVGWTETSSPDTPKPAHPVPVLTVTSEVPSATSSIQGSVRPLSVEVRDGVLTAPTGLPLYTFDFDTMVGMSHCVDACASTWRPFKAAPDAKPVGDWALIGRDDGSIQWTYKTKPLYTYSKDVPGGPATGAGQANWRPAR